MASVHALLSKIYSVLVVLVGFFYVLLGVEAYDHLDRLAGLIMFLIGLLDVYLGILMYRGRMVSYRLVVAFAVVPFFVFGYWLQYAVGMN